MKNTHVPFIATLALLGLGLFPCHGQPGASRDAGADDEGKRPNIIFIMADDLGWADVGYNGAPFYETPHIDALCTSGMQFNHGYPGAGNCMPSRSCIMTGMYTPRTQMWTPGMLSKGNTRYMKFLVPSRGGKENNVFPSLQQLEPSVVSAAETLKQVGYRTAHLGKWHLGPDGQGFDRNDTNGKGAGLDKKFYGNPDVAEWLTDTAVDYIKQNRDHPFFVYLCHWDVHGPIRARSKVVEAYRKKLAGKQWSKDWNPTYAAMIEAVDTSVGRVRQAVRDAGIAGNTLLIFTSDNGGASGATWSEPLKGAKGAFYEGGIRVPLCMSWPGTIKPGSTCDTPVTGVDWLPTFAELAGAPLPTRQPVDGASVVPLMQGKPGALADRAIFWHYPLYLQGSAHGKVIPVHGTERMYWRATPSSIIRRGDWKLMQFFESGKTELYNIRQDIAEKTDLSTKHPEKAAELLKELQQWQAGTRATIPTKLNPAFNPAAPETGKKRGKGKGKTRK
jgi:arylsulfatase A-like enzyme